MVTKLRALQERFKSKTEARYIKALEEALENILGKLALKHDVIETKRLISIRKAIEKEINDIYMKLQTPLKEDTKEFAELSYSVNASLFGVSFVGVPNTLAKKILDLDKIVLMGDKAFTLNELLKNAQHNQVRRVKQIMSAGIISNDGYRNITKKVKETIALSQREIRTIVHTSIAQANDETLIELNREFDDVTIGWESRGVLDNRTTLICASLDGVRYMKPKYPNFESIPNRPPRHFNCRSTLSPITKNERVVKRPSKGDKRKKIPSNTTFKEWFNDQSPKFQEGYLGKSRYRLFKENKLTLNSFVDIKSGKRLTIKEIKALL